MPSATQATREEFLADIRCQDAVIRRIKLWARRLQGVSGGLAELPLHGEYGRYAQLLIHEYDDVDMNSLETIEDLPPLIAELEKILPPAKKS